MVAGWPSRFWWMEEMKVGCEVQQGEQEASWGKKKIMWNGEGNDIRQRESKAGRKDKQCIMKIKQKMLDI